VDPAETLRACRSVLVIDWPSADVPESLARAGRTVIVKGGPGPRDYSARELRDGELVTRRIDGPPGHIDLVYAHRPLAELVGIAALAKQLGAKGVWRQSGLSGPESKDPRGCWLPAEESRQGREIVESAGLRYVDDVYIGAVARGLGATDEST
jgi:sugar phosphate isomerase/epimerase